MEAVVFLLIALNIASVYTYPWFFYRIPKVSKESLEGPERTIFNGMQAEPDQFPFMIKILFLFYNGRSGTCSGSLLKTDLVLTAAHCVEAGIPENTVLVGGAVNLVEYLEIRRKLLPEDSFNSEGFDLQEIRAAEFFKHPGYLGVSDQHHDIGLIRTEKPFSLNGINTTSVSTEKMKKPMNCTILGYGLTIDDSSTSQLNYAFEIAQTAEMGCSVFPKGPFICLQKGTAGICQGDSGSPLICEDKVWGVASFTVPTEGDLSCGANSENYYTEIYSELDWLNNPNGGKPSVVVTFKNIFVLTVLFFVF